MVLGQTDVPLQGFRHLRIARSSHSNTLFHSICRVHPPSCFRYCIAKERAERRRGEGWLLLFILLLVQAPTWTVIVCFAIPPRVDCCIAAYLDDSHRLYLPSPIFVVALSRDGSKNKEEKRTSPFCPPSWSSANPDSKLFVLSRPHSWLLCHCLF